MNANDDPLNPAAVAVEPGDSGAAEAKPAKPRRRSKSAAADEAAQTPAGEAASEAAPKPRTRTRVAKGSGVAAKAAPAAEQTEPAAQPPVRPAARRGKVEPAATRRATEPGTQQALGEADRPAIAEPAERQGSAEPAASRVESVAAPRDEGADSEVAHTAPRDEVRPDEPPRTDAAAPESGALQAEPTPFAAAGSVPPDAVPADAAELQRGPRNRRRGRNRGRRERDDTLPPDIAAADVADDDEADDELPALPPTDINEVFSDVLSGAFDAEPAAGEDVDETAQAKRVLAADPDAPKLHKVLAQNGIGSRRDIEQWIADGQITVNGEPAHIGQRVMRGDQVRVNGRPIKVWFAPPAPRVIAYHKPAGEIVTHDDPQNRPTVFRRLPRLQHGRWLSVGRLDISTEGLLLFTNSGDLANRLMHPRFGVEREYAVRVLGQLDDDTREELLEGVDIEPGQQAAFKSISDGGGEGANRWYRVVITEGRNREVRRLFDAVGLTVNRLIRIRYGNVVLPKGLKRGVWVALPESDVREIRKLAGGDAPSNNDRNERNERQGKRNKRGRGNQNERWPRESSAAPPPVDERDRDHDHDDDEHHGPIPNPLQQTYDRRFVQNQRGPFGQGRGGGGSGGGAKNRGGGQQGTKQPDPMQTSVGYIGADAFFRKLAGGGRRGRGRR